MPTGLKISLGVVLPIVGVVMLVMGEDSPFDGEGLIMQFLPKRVVGIVSVALGLIFLASLVSPAANHAVDGIKQFEEKQHSVEDLLSAVVGIPFLLGFVGLMGFLAFESAGERAIMMSVIWVFFGLFAVIGFFECTAYLHLTPEPITVLSHW